jgi:hypothetical protein
VTYWVTLSNGEILRIRANSERNAKDAANIIIKYTKDTVYNQLNLKISGGCNRYKFYLDSGEIAYWSGITKKDAEEEAIQTRKELCEIMNKEYPDLMHLDPLAAPRGTVKTETKKGELIPLPEVNKFINVSTNCPDFKSKLDDSKPFWQWGSLKQFKTSFFVFSSILFPAENEKEAEKITRAFYAVNKRLIDETINDYNEHKETYKIQFVDGDLYHIPGVTQSEAYNKAIEIHNNKYTIFEKILIGASKDNYDDILRDFNIKSRGIDIKSVKSVTLSSEKYTPKNPKKFKLIE